MIISTEQQQIISNQYLCEEIWGKVFSYTSTREMGRVFSTCRTLAKMSQSFWLNFFMRELSQIPHLNRINLILSHALKEEKPISAEHAYKSLQTGLFPFKQWDGHATLIIPLKNERMASALNGNEILICKQDGSEARYLYGHTKRITCLVELNDGSIASTSIDNTIRIWDQNSSLSLVLNIDNAMEEIYRLVELKNGHIAAGGKCGLIYIWKRDDSVFQIQKGHTTAIISLIELSDGCIASASGGFDDNKIKIWSQDLSTSLMTMNHPSFVLFIKGLKDGSIAVGLDNGLIYIWKRNHPIPEILDWHKSAIRCMTELEDGSIVAGSCNGLISIWKRDGSWPIILRGHTKDIYCLIKLKDNHIASGSEDGSIRLWKSDGSASFALRGHSRAISSIVELSNGHIASGSFDGIRIWCGQKEIENEWFPKPIERSKGMKRCLQIATSISFFVLPILLAYLKQKDMF